MSIFESDWEKKKKQNRENKSKRSGYRLLEGNAWNPLRKYPRNMKCFCGETELKAKKCCLPKMSLICKRESYTGLKMAVDRARDSRG